MTTFTSASEWLLLLFIPMAWSFVCPTEVLAFNARLHEFETRGCAVVFASTDSEQVLRAWSGTPRDAGGLGCVHVPMLSDRAHKLARAYGVLDEDEGTAQRAMFIVDPQGVLRHASVNDDDVGRSVDEARRIVDALIFKDEFGVGCPVDWKKGDAGVKLERAGEKTLMSMVAERPGIKRLTSWSSWASGRQRTSTVASGVATSPRPSVSTTTAAESPTLQRSNPLDTHMGTQSGAFSLSPVSPMNLTMKPSIEDVMNNFQAVGVNGMAY